MTVEAPKINESVPLASRFSWSTSTKSTLSYHLVSGTASTKLSRFQYCLCLAILKPASQQSTQVEEEIAYDPSKMTGY